MVIAKEKWPVFVLLGYAIVLSFCSLTLPFFWDSVLFSRIAHWYNITGFESLSIPENLDTGNQPFFPLLLAFCWRVFGKYLWVGHFMMIPFLLGIVYQYWLLVKRFLQPSAYGIAVVLFVLEPTLMAQSTQVIIDVPLLFFYLLGLNAILSSYYEQGEARTNTSNLLLVAATLGLAFTNLRGVLAIGALTITETCVYWQIHRKRITHVQVVKYIPTLVVVCVWLLYHKMATGWAFMQPHEYAEQRQLLSFVGMLKNLLFIAGRFFDFGKVLLYLFVMIILIRKVFYKQKLTADGKILWTIVTIPLLLFCLLFVPFSNPIGHRYFLLVFVLFTLQVAVYINELKQKLLKYLLLMSFTIALVVGPFIIWPFPYSNGWDSTIVHIRYFGLEKQMRAWLDDQQIGVSQVVTGFPCHYSEQDTYLTADTTHYANKWYGGIENYPYVLQSNITNSFTVNEMQNIQKNWVLLHEVQKWPFYIRLYEKK